MPQSTPSSCYHYKYHRHHHHRHHHLSLTCDNQDLPSFAQSQPHSPRCTLEWNCYSIQKPAPATAQFSLRKQSIQRLPRFLQVFELHLLKRHTFSPPERDLTYTQVFSPLGYCCRSKSRPQIKSKKKRGFVFKKDQCTCGSQLWLVNHQFRMWRQKTMSGSSCETTCDL